MTERLSASNKGGLNPVKAGSMSFLERAIVYGPPGIGKTPLLAEANTVEGMAPALVIMCDDGAKSLGNLQPDVDVELVGNFSRISEILNVLIRDNGAGYRTIILDGATTVREKGIEYLYYGEGQCTDPIKFKTATMGNQGYALSTQQMRIIVAAFKLIPSHLFFTAWARDVSVPSGKMGDNQPPLWVPDFPEKTLNIVAGGFDSILYYSFVDGNKRVLQSRGTTRVMARDRGDRLPETLENPTMAQIAKYWHITQ